MCESSVNRYKIIGRRRCPMKSVLMVLGIAITILGLIPFIFAYPYNYGLNLGLGNY
jgi:hypothetical protein